MFDQAEAQSMQGPRSTPSGLPALAKAAVSEKAGLRHLGADSSAAASVIEPALPHQRSWEHVIREMRRGLRHAQRCTRDTRCAPLRAKGIRKWCPHVARAKAYGGSGTPGGGETLDTSRQMQPHHRATVTCVLSHSRRNARRGRPRRPQVIRGSAATYRRLSYSTVRMYVTLRSGEQLGPPMFSKAIVCDPGGRGASST